MRSPVCQLRFHVFRLCMHSFRFLFRPDGRTNRGGGSEGPDRKRAIQQQQLTSFSFKSEKVLGWEPLLGCSLATSRSTTGDSALSSDVLSSPCSTSSASASAASVSNVSAAVLAVPASATFSAANISTAFSAANVSTAFSAVNAVSATASRDAWANQ